MVDSIEGWIQTLRRNPFKSREKSALRHPVADRMLQVEWFPHPYFAGNERPVAALRTARSRMWIGRRDHSAVMTSGLPFTR
jgi:hypothetical protein